MTTGNDTLSPATMARTRRAGPFSEGARWYIQQGWNRPIPVRGKVCILKGVTGYHGHNPDSRELEAWLRKYGGMNIAIVLPDGIIGLDVDAYDNRPGAATLARLERELGRLPVTWRSTARRVQDGDRVSGVYLFSVRRDQRWVADLGLGSGVEVVQHSHRYVVAAPSIHPDTRRPYWWWQGDLRSRIPHIKSIPEMPDNWQRYLTDPRPVPTHEYAHKEAALAWRGRHGRQQCPQMEVSTRAAIIKMREAGRYGGLHDEMTRQTWSIIHMAAEGHLGLNSALDGLKAVFFRVGRDRRRPLNTEWIRAIENAIAHAATQKQSKIDPCVELAGGIHAQHH